MCDRVDPLTLAARSHPSRLPFSTSAGGSLCECFIMFQEYPCDRVFRCPGFACGLLLLLLLLLFSCSSVLLEASMVRFVRKWFKVLGAHRCRWKFICMKKGVGLYTSKEPFKRDYIPVYKVYMGLII